MHRFFIPQPYSDTMTIMGVDARHIYTVLRMQCGSRVQIVSDDGVTALAEIADANESVVTVKCLEVLAESHEPSVRIVLAQGLSLIHILEKKLLNRMKRMLRSKNCRTVF